MMKQSAMDKLVSIFIDKNSEHDTHAVIRDSLTGEAVGFKDEESARAVALAMLTKDKRVNGLDSDELEALARQFVRERPYYLNGYRVIAMSDEQLAVAKRFIDFPDLGWITDYNEQSLIIENISNEISLYLTNTLNCERVERGEPEWLPDEETLDEWATDGTLVSEIYESISRLFSLGCFKEDALHTIWDDLGKPYYVSDFPSPHCVDVNSRSDIEQACYEQITASDLVDYATSRAVDKFMNAYPVAVA